MSPIQRRARTAYVLISINIVLLVIGIALTGSVLRLRTDIQEGVEIAYKGCIRGNVLRSVARYVLLNPSTATPESRAKALLPELQEQPCDVLYPR